MPELETLRTIGFAQLVKYNAATGEFEGVMASARPDKAKEAMNYQASKPYFKKWITTFAERTGNKSLGNVREMHDLKAAGKLTAVTFEDPRELIRVRGKVVDKQARAKCEEGVYTGLSIGGSYVGDPLPDPTDPTIMRYIANPTEVSLVDDPCNPDATFTLLGADGATKVMKFAPRIDTIAADDDDTDDIPTPRPLQKTQGRATPDLVHRVLKRWIPKESVWQRLAKTAA